MNNRTARSIRKSLSLPRRPRDMNPGERRFYRGIKARCAGMSRAVRALFLRNLADVAAAPTT